ncbi:MAG: AzlD domain-containing protein [Terrimesophilobacter sp.]
MTLWLIVIVASLACLALKLVGYLVPANVLDAPAPSRIANLLTVALLAALVAVQTLGAGGAVQVDARVPALAVAVALFALRVPFVLVVILAAITAALIRLSGWG